MLNPSHHGKPEKVQAWEITASPAAFLPSCGTDTLVVIRGDDQYVLRARKNHFVVPQHSVTLSLPETIGIVDVFLPAATFHTDE